MQRPTNVHLSCQSARGDCESLPTLGHAIRGIPGTATRTGHAWVPSGRACQVQLRQQAIRAAGCPSLLIFPAGFGKGVRGGLAREGWGWGRVGMIAATEGGILSGFRMGRLSGSGSSGSPGAHRRAGGGRVRVRSRPVSSAGSRGFGSGAHAPVAGERAIRMGAQRGHEAEATAPRARGGAVGPEARAGPPSASAENA